MTTAIINKARCKLSHFYKKVNSVPINSLNDVTVSFIEKNNLQFLLITHRGPMPHNMAVTIRQFKIIYPFITLILVSDQLDPRTNIELMRAGVDNFLNHEDDPSVLSKNICKIISRIKNKSNNLPILQAFDLRLDANTRKVTRSGKEIRLRRKEFELLECMMQRPGQVFNRIELLEIVWGYRCDTLSNTVDVHVSSLRSRIDKGFKTKIIKTVYGYGYKVEG